MTRMAIAGGYALLMMGTAAQAQFSAMSGVEPAIVRGPSSTPPDAATRPAPGTSTAAMVRATDRAAGPMDPIAPGTPNAGAPAAHVQPHQ